MSSWRPWRVPEVRAGHVGVAGGRRDPPAPEEEEDARGPPPPEAARAERLAENGMLWVLAIVLLMAGAVMAGVGTDSWLHDRIERGEATVTALEQRGSADTGGLGVECAARVRLGRPGAPEGLVVTPGPCNAAALGAAVSVGYPRRRPADMALAAACPMSHSAALGFMVVGWTLLGWSLAAAALALSSLSGGSKGAGADAGADAVVYLTAA